MVFLFGFCEHAVYLFTYLLTQTALYRVADLTNEKPTERLTADLNRCNSTTCSLVFNVINSATTRKFIQMRFWLVVEIKRN